MKISSAVKKGLLVFCGLFLILVLYLYFVLYIPGEPDFEDSIPTIVPKDTALFIHLNHWFDQVERVGKSAFWKTLENRLERFSQTSEWKSKAEFVLKTTQILESKIQEIPGLSGFEFGEMFNQEIGIALEVDSVKTSRKTTVVKEPAILWVSKMKTDEKRLVNMALWSLPKMASFTSFPDFLYEKQDQNIHHFTLKTLIHVPKPGLEKGVYSFQEFYVHRFYNLLLLSNHKTFLEKSIALLQTPASNSASLANTFAFKQAKKETRNAENLVYINNNVHFQNFYNLEKNLAPEGLRFPFQELYALIKQAFDYNFLDTLAGYWSADSLIKESRFHASLIMGVNQNQLPNYYHLLYNQEEKPFEILDVVPEDCAFMRAYRTDMVQEWNYFRELKYFGLLSTRLDQIIRGGNQEYDRIKKNYFQTEILPRFGNEYAFICAYQHFSEEKSAGVIPFPYLALIFEFPHLESRKDLIQFFVHGIGVNDFGEMVEKEIRGKEVYTFPKLAALIAGSNQPCIGFIDRFMIVTTNIDFFEKLLNVKEKRAPGLKEDSDFILMGGNKEQNLLLYINVNELRQSFVPILHFYAEDYATSLQREHRQKILKENPKLSEGEIDKRVEQKFIDDMDTYNKDGKQILDSLNFLNKISASITMKGDQLFFALDVYLNPHSQ